LVEAQSPITRDPTPTQRPQKSATAVRIGTQTVTDSQVLTAGAPTQFSIPYEDFNVRSWRSNLVFRWEYRPGSTLYVVWQQNREGFAPNGELVSFDGLVDPFRQRVGYFGFDDPLVSRAVQFLRGEAELLAADVGSREIGNRE
jgi:hypothetical protein